MASNPKKTLPKKNMATSLGIKKRGRPRKLDKLKNSIRRGRPRKIHATPTLKDSTISTVSWSPENTL